MPEVGLDNGNSIQKDDKEDSPILRSFIEHSFVLYRKC